jgi:CRP-like cAMP-binding protein
MESLIAVIRAMITISDQELTHLLGNCLAKRFKKQEILSKPYVTPNEIFFVQKGMIRVLITDENGIDHTIHFAQENQFIADYAAFMLKKPSAYTLQALEDTDVVIMPRSIIEWGYQYLQQGDKLGRLIAEYYFIYQDNRIKNMFALTPRERYDSITEVFPDIHNRVPQHMIASYLGITPVHLSRLKKQRK